MQKVFTRWNSDMSATTALESIPPERKAPSGTSLIRRTLTASRSSRRTSEAASVSSMASCGRKESDQ